jgi:hypothetical protein
MRRTLYLVSTFTARMCPSARKALRGERNWLSATKAATFRPVTAPDRIGVRMSRGCIQT